MWGPAPPGEFVSLGGFSRFGRFIGSNCVAKLREFGSNAELGGVGRCLRLVRLHRRAPGVKGGSECRLPDEGRDNRYFTIG